MGSKVRVDQAIDDLEDWSDQLEQDDEEQKSRVRYNPKRRRQIEDYMEERFLASQLRDTYDELT
ncbi:PA3496 family putative envelope integrity protein [Marinobacterium sp. LSUCC0821]|jgi:hypothetical protein|uniref:PA3496 family putative envelope integrity protein n=1 Tax=Marinobacterium sp. LSUCC0821 TaxID=2668067 RepID=UPI0014517E1F|nr:hypothetical protein [Marinobacterium sp. LSUCC0821]QJD70880.1 hypothetical protein HH196_03855 [Marinobacterium sp. LSUCC0821]